MPPNQALLQQAAKQKLNTTIDYVNLEPGSQFNIITILNNERKI